MNISFKKNLNRSYMIVEKVTEFSENDFQVQMLLENKIESLLPFRYEMINGKADLFYEISSRQVFIRQFEISKMTFANLRAFCFALRTLARALEEYLLDPNNIILKKECIFTNPEGNDFVFCYHPYYHGDILAELRELFNYILQIMDYEDENAVRLAYEIHGKIQTDHFVLNDIMEILQQDFSGTFQKTGEIEAWEPEQDEGIKTPVITIVEEPSFFEKMSLYLKGRNLIDVLEDINNGDIRKKIQNEKTLYPAAEHAAPREQLPIGNRQLLPGESFMEESIYPEELAPPSNGTMLLGKAEYTPRKLIGLKSQEGNCIELAKLPFTIGKLDGLSDAVIDLPAISRLHIRVYPGNNTGEYQIEDLNSTNGTFSNEQKLMPFTKTPLREGDVIRLAEEEFQFC